MAHRFAVPKKRKPSLCRLTAPMEYDRSVPAELTECGK